MLYLPDTLPLSFRKKFKTDENAKRKEKNPSDFPLLALLSLGSDDNSKT